MLRAGRSLFHKFSTLQSKILISNSNSIHFNLATEEYLFESSIHFAIKPNFINLLFFFTETVPQLWSAAIRTLGNNAEISSWETME